MAFFPAFTRVLKSKKVLQVAFVFLGLLGASLAAATSDLETIHQSVLDTGTQGLGMLGASSITAGIVFFVASAFKFYRWKQNPQQITVGNAISLMLIGVLMISLPFTFSTARRAVFGSEGSTNTFGNSGLADIVSPGSL
jgi:hypothetical protein